jgi:hypothetical protein
VDGVVLAVTVDGDRTDVEFAAGADHAHRDLAAIGDQHSSKHVGNPRGNRRRIGRVSYSKVVQERPGHANIAMTMNL